MWLRVLLVQKDPRGQQEQQVPRGTRDLRVQLGKMESLLISLP
jgi:hypothetical protein